MIMHKSNIYNRGYKTSMPGNSDTSLMLQGSPV